MFKKLLAGLVTAVLSLGVVALVAGPASAHHNTISAKVVCAVDGKYTVTWSVTNSETNKSELITASNLPGVVAPNTTTLGFGETKTFPQTVDARQNLELVLTGFWDGDPNTNRDDVYSQNSGYLSKGAFPTGCIKVTPGATPNPSVCDGPNHFTDPSYTLKKVDGVTYTVDGQTRADGTWPATNGTTVNIVASVSDPKYQIVGTSSWTFTFTAPTPGSCTVEVEPVTPDFKKQVCTAPGQHSLAQYFIPAKTGVIYSVKINGVETDVTVSGWYDVPDGVTAIQIIARGDTANFYTLKGGTKVYDYTVDAAGTCLVEIKPKDPTIVTGTCDVVNHPGVLPALTYTLIYVPNVVYEVSIDGGASFTDTAITADTKVTVTPGTHLVVKAHAADPTKYQTKAFTFDYTFVDPGDCKGIVEPVTPVWSHQYCDDTKDPRVVVPGAVIVTGAPHVTYSLDGVPIAGLQDGVATTIALTNGPHSITITYDTSKYNLKLPAGVTLPYDFTVNSGTCLPTHPLVTPATVASQIGCFNSGSYTLKNDLSDPDAVIWTVNGSQVSAGKYSVAASGTVTISAAPNSPDYGFAPGAQTSWKVSFK
ncbi:MAG TPA: hypothetical protein VNR36_02235, partial [Pseudolysinimonas sp.]|nr:hypothetical protein [Pseudolysinimonas sp.]